MDWTLILAIVAIIAAVGWAASWTTLRDLLSNARELKKEYQAGMADGSLSDDEYAGMLPHLVAVIEDSAKLYQTFLNLVMKLIALFRKGK
jgi:hypothetical protein